MSTNIFNTVKLQRPNRNTFDLSHDVKMSLDMGKLYPILCEECVPGDKFTIGCEAIVRFAPMIAPVMQRFNVFMHYFFVPNRIIWDGWEDWITQQDEDRVFPTCKFTGYSGGSGPIDLPDYMGIPRNTRAISRDISALPFQAYYKIWYEYYRDQNLQDFDYQPLVDGDNGVGYLDGSGRGQIRYRAWEHDYFTAALPWPQKGAAVDLPLGDVTLKENWYENLQAPYFRSGLDIPQSPGDLSQVNSGGQDFIQSSGNPNGRSAYDPNGSLVVGATTVNDFRRAVRLQEFLELNALGGTRYTEVLRMHFGVISPDARMQRPEYITGIRTPVVISEVLNTTGEDGGLPQGNMAGHGIAATKGRYGTHYCYEHGYIIGIMSVMPKASYQQGIPKHFLKFDDQYKYYWPKFAHIGEQAVENQELYMEHSAPKGEFGYVPRYSEYKFAFSRVAGEFRTSLNYWHLGRIFDGEPNLNSFFIQCIPGKRIFAVEGPENSLYAHVYNKVRASRLMPVFGTPTL